MMTTGARPPEAPEIYAVRRGRRSRLSQVVSDRRSGDKGKDSLHRIQVRMITASPALFHQGLQLPLDIFIQYEIDLDGLRCPLSWSRQ